MNSVVPLDVTNKPVENSIPPPKLYIVAATGTKVFTRIAPDAAVLSHTFILGPTAIVETKIPLTIPVPVLKEIPELAFV